MAASKSRAKAGRPTGRFTQHRKLDRLREVLGSRATGLTLQELATLVNVSERSVRRYLHELSRSIEVESLEVVPGGAHVWRIKPSERGRAVNLRRTQAYGLLATRRVLELLRGSALFDEIEVALREIHKLAERPVRQGSKGEVSADARLEGRFGYAPGPLRTYTGRGEDIDGAFLAVAEGRVLRVSRTAGGTREVLTLHPYGLLMAEGALHVVGHHVEGQVLEALPLEEVESLEVLAKPCSVPESFDVMSVLEGRFGVRRGSDGAATRVLVEFDPAAADEVRAIKVHPTQKTAVAADGRVRVTFTTARLGRVRDWVLGFGPRARVIEPPELVDAVVATLDAARKRYDLR